MTTNFKQRQIIFWGCLVICQPLLIKNNVWLPVCVGVVTVHLLWWLVVTWYWRGWATSRTLLIVPPHLLHLLLLLHLQLPPLTLLQRPHTLTPRGQRRRSTAQPLTSAPITGHHVHGQTFHLLIVTARARLITEHDSAHRFASLLGRNWVPTGADALTGRRWETRWSLLLPFSSSSTSVVSPPLSSTASTIAGQRLWLKQASRISRVLVDGNPKPVETFWLFCTWF